MNCLGNLSERILLDMNVGVFGGSTLFCVSDIEDSLKCLKYGKASGLNDLCKGISCVLPADAAVYCTSERSV